MRSFEGKREKDQLIGGTGSVRSLGDKTEDEGI